MPDEQLTLYEVERRYVLRVLDQHRGNISAAARALGIYRSSLQRRLRRYRAVTAAGAASPP